MVKNPPANPGDERDVGLIPEWGRSPGGGHGNSLQYSCLENPMNRRAWWATVHRRIRNPHMHMCVISMHTHNVGGKSFADVIKLSMLR